MTSLRTKDQFNKLSIENKETVMFFLNDRFTEDNVWIKLNEDGSLHSVYEANECELKETIFKKEYIDKDILLYILTDETTMSKAKKVKEVEDLQVGAIYKYSVTGSPYRVTENKNEVITLRMVTEHNIIMESAPEVKLAVCVWMTDYRHNMTRCEHLMGNTFYAAQLK